MSLSRHCCILRQSVIAPGRSSRRLLSPNSAIVCRNFADSKPSTSTGPATASTSESTKDVTPESGAAGEPSASPAAPVRGDLAGTSIFAQEDARVTRLRARSRAAQEQKQVTKSGQIRPTLLKDRDPAAMAAVLDPRPRARVRFERRMVLQELRKRGRLTKEQEIKRTERQFVQRSQFHKTGMKKVAPLARQISGKPIEEAIVQMRFSKKKAATWILDHLVESKNKAIIERGMGLGLSSGATATAKATKPVVKQIELKDGRKHKIMDRTGIYIAQAWVNKGPYGKSLSKRARGRIDILNHPTTSITVMLKEEATRIREWEERVAKEERRKPWMPLPNKPIGAQRPYYTW